MRKLEFLVGDALAKGADHLVTQGAVQSNHVRQTAAAAAKLSLACNAVLEHRIETSDSAYLNSGNVLLDRLLGCAIECRPGGADMQAAIEEAGARPYLIPAGRSPVTRRTGNLRRAGFASMRPKHSRPPCGNASTYMGFTARR